MKRKLFFYMIIVVNLLFFSIPNYSEIVSNFNTSLTVGYCTGCYFNDTVSITANTTTTLNVTMTSNLSIIIDIFTISNVTNSSIFIIQYNSTPPNTTGIGIHGLNEFFEISIGSNLNSSLGWILLNIPYNETEVRDAGLDESSLKLYRYNASSGSWLAVTTSGVNTVNEYVWANLTSFSFYGLGGSLHCGNGVCNTGETNSNCPSDCPSTIGGSIITTGGCTYNWKCTNWSECSSDIQTRFCTNLGSCTDNKKKPIESQTCAMKSTVPTNITPPISTSIKTPEQPKIPTITSAPTTPLGLGIGLIAVITVLGVVIFVIIKRRNLSRKILGE